MVMNPGVQGLAKLLSTFVHEIHHHQDESLIMNVLQRNGCNTWNLNHAYIIDGLACDSRLLGDGIRTMVLEAMDTVVAVAIAILAAIFVASLIGLVVICKKRYCKPLDLISRQYRDQQPDVNLVQDLEGPQENPSGVELDDVGLSPNLELVLQNQAWVNDATGLAPHCLAILKTCHALTEKMVGMTMGQGQQLRSPETLTDLVAIAKRINPRVDDVVRSLYPPLDPRLLEARCTALVLSVNHLVLVTKKATRLSGVIDWVDQSLADVEDHLKVLQEASQAYEFGLRSGAIQQQQTVQSSLDNQIANNSSSNNQTINPNPEVQPVQNMPNAAHQNESSEV